MPGYLDTYGEEGARSAARAKVVQRSIIAVVSLALLATIGYYTFRTHGQERVVDQFVADLKNGDYSSAYALWGCTAQTPCKDYSAEKFQEDWGPKSPYANAADLHVDNVDYCDTGVVFTVTYPRQDTVGLWVDRTTNVIGFAPWTRCPGNHLRLKEFFRSLFTSSGKDGSRSS
jgi:hypothetical protein